MLLSTAQMLQQARRNHYAVGAFNVYTLEGARAMVSAAEEAASPAILQVLPSALKLGGTALIALCLEASRSAAVPLSVHLDHCRSGATIDAALAAGISLVMVDGSHLPLDRSLALTRRVTERASRQGSSAEAELGRLAGTEDGMTVAQREARLTDTAQARTFVEETGVHALAVCIGNLHGAYPTLPDLDFDRPAAIAEQVRIPLVLHGTSGLPDTMITRVVDLGVGKFNINTELRDACMAAGGAYLAAGEKRELVERMQVEINAMKQVVLSTIALFGSPGKAS
jgi:tagatose 1,6-diphosphate aldolase GatY/KbaY